MPQHFHLAPQPRSSLLYVCASIVLAFLCATPLHAHDFKAGSIVVDHPYATPTVTGAQSGAVYFRTIKNTGHSADQLLSADTDIATRVGIHHMQLDGDVMRMREVPTLALPGNSEQAMRHGQANGYHLMLEGLIAPLKNGDRFDLRLKFEKAGERTVKVWVQKPRSSVSHQH